MEDQQKVDVDSSRPEEVDELKEEELKEVSGGSGGATGGPLTPHH